MKFNWPATGWNDLAPWYVMLRRTVFILPFYVFLVLIVAVSFMGWGREDAEDVWNELK